MSKRNGHFARLVIERDEVCQICGASSNLQAHHIIPISKGGSDIPENGIALCSACHADQHPDVPRGLILEHANGKAASARWNATSLAAELDCCTRTITRIAKALSIERLGGTWGFDLEAKAAIQRKLLGIPKQKIWSKPKDKRPQFLLRFPDAAAKERAEEWAERAGFGTLTDFVLQAVSDFCDSWESQAK